MIVTEMFTRMMGAYPAFTPAAMESLGPGYRARLGRHEGPVLERAWADLTADWTPKAGQRFPLPKDFENYLPTGKLDLGKERSKPLDIEGRNRRAPEMLRQWRDRQGRKASKGIPEVLLALEYLAKPLCDQAAWMPDAQPVILTHDQLRLARQRAVSQERLKRHGNPPKDGNAWWHQVEEIQAQWGIAITREEWTTKERQAKPAAIEARPERPPFVPATDTPLARAAEKWRNGKQEASAA